MLKKIVSIKNVGRFVSSAAAGNPQLVKYTLINGPNGSGKTTLCAILRSLKTGESSHIVGRKTLGASDGPTVELLGSQGVLKFSGENWTSTWPNVEIFDGVFVADNVHSGEVVELGHKRNFYRIIVGERGVRLAEEDAALATQSREKTGEISAAAKLLQPHIPSGMKVEEFIELPKLEMLDELIADKKKTIDAVRQSASVMSRPGLSKFVFPELPEGLRTLLGRSIDGIGRDAEDMIAQHLAVHEMPAGSGEWIATGLEHVRDETCPFCGQGVGGIPLIAAYRAIFGGEYKALAKDIVSTRSEIADAFGELAVAKLEATAEQNRAGVEFWTRYCSFDGVSVVYPADAPQVLRVLGQAAIDLLDRKNRTPLEAMQPDAPFLAAAADYDRIRAAALLINKNIDSANQLILAKKVVTGAADPKVVERELQQLEATRMRHGEAAGQCDQYVQLIRSKVEIDKRRTAVRSELDAHTKGVVKPYESRINALLDAFNAGFRITETRHSYPGGVATSTYQLLINDTAVEVGDSSTPRNRPSFKNTLSSGDRTTLALAFFLAHLERSSSLPVTTVVFDDPFNSQDAFRRRQTIHEILRLADGCEQVIVLSHDPMFLKQIWEKAPAADRVSLAIVDHRKQGSKILPVDLEKATQGRTANDIDDLQTYLTTGAGKLIDVVRKIRGVLETYCRTTYPSSFDPNDWLGDIARKIREGGETHPARALYEELDQINDYTAQYHHGEDVKDATPDQIDPDELTGFVKRTLRIVNALQA